jgi:hypothetical protein
MQLSKFEFDERSKTMFYWMGYGLDFESSCELAGLDPNHVTRTVEKGRQFVLSGDDIEHDGEYFQNFTEAKYALKIDAITFLRNIAKDKGNYRAAQILLQLGHDDNKPAREMTPFELVQGYMLHCQEHPDEDESM